MKKYTLIFGMIILATLNNMKINAQVGGLVFTVEGGAAGGSIDGVPAATEGNMICILGIASDASDNIYIADRDGNCLIRKVQKSTGLIYTVAGENSGGIGGGFSGDGGLATNAQLKNPLGIWIDGSNNLYIADYGNSRIREVNAATNIITTVAGGGSSTADGVPATVASINPQCIVLDAAGNLYTGSTNKVRKIDAMTGLISTVAGNGTSGETGDGGPATNATLTGIPASLAIDGFGNVYIVDANATRVRMVNAATGIITTVAGGGASFADGVPATSDSFQYITGCSLDPAGNLYISDQNREAIFMVNKTSGLIYKIAGGGDLFYDGIPALSFGMLPGAIYVDAVQKNLYFSICSSKVYKFSLPNAGGSTITSTSGAFSVFNTDLCSGPGSIFSTATYISGQGVKTYFGDGSTDSGAIVPAVAGGSDTCTHVYNATGAYSVRHILYTGASPVDSISYIYNYVFCRPFTIAYFIDTTGSCVMDSEEHFNFSPVQTEVDSNGTILDTISATCGLNYYAYGSPGDIYTFKTIATPAHVMDSCPPSATIYDTLELSGSYPPKLIGLSCLGGTDFDLQVFTSFIFGTHAFMGDIVVDNTYCYPEPATLVMQLSPKFEYEFAYPTPTSVVGNTITWNIGPLSSNLPYPLHFNVYGYAPGGVYYPVGDTVMSTFTINPVTGDMNPADNVNNRIDSVTAAYDPNYMAVQPSGCIPSGTAPTQLQYTIDFENTGNDTAHNIYVMDTLSGLLNPKTLQLVSATGEMYVSQMTDMANDAIIKFNFPGINLLDSSHHNNCTGVVIFNINTESDIADGAQIWNHAGIFFDDNQVVLTNNVAVVKNCANVFTPVISNSSSPVQLYPNPATSELTIKADKDYYQFFIISDIFGRNLIRNQINAATTTVDIAQLSDGIYYVTFVGTNGTHAEKFVKL